jgi:hypothetical protein
MSLSEWLDGWEVSVCIQHAPAPWHIVLCLLSPRHPRLRIADAHTRLFVLITASTRDFNCIVVVGSLPSGTTSKCSQLKAEVYSAFVRNSRRIAHISRFESAITPLWKPQILYMVLQNVGFITQTITIWTKLGWILRSWIFLRANYGTTGATASSHLTWLPDVLSGVLFGTCETHRWENKCSETSSCETRLPGVALTCTSGTLISVSCHGSFLVVLPPIHGSL